MKYNIGDFIRSKKYRKFGWNNEQNYDLNFCKKFPNTICAEYCARNINDKQTLNKYYDDNHINYKLLIEIIKKRKTDDLIANKDDVHVHLRIGDVMDKLVWRPDNEYRHFTEFLNGYVKHWNGGQYVKPLKYYEKCCAKLKKYNIKNVILVAYNYDKDKESNSYKYTMAIKTFFIDKGYNVNIVYSKNADDDFILMSNAKYFIPSGGGYSLLINKICLLNNNIVI